MWPVLRTYSRTQEEAVKTKIFEDSQVQSSQPLETADETKLKIPEDSQVPFQSSEPLEEAVKPKLKIPEDSRVPSTSSKPLERAVNPKTPENSQVPNS